MVFFSFGHTVYPCANKIFPVKKNLHKELLFNIIAVSRPNNAIALFLWIEPANENLVIVFVSEKSTNVDAEETHRRRCIDNRLDNFVITVMITFKLLMIFFLKNSDWLHHQLWIGFICVVSITSRLIINIRIPFQYKGVSVSKL